MEPEHLEPPRPNAIRLLHDYQVPHVHAMEQCLVTRPAVLEASDTGMGKTIVWCAIASRLQRPLFVICPKPVVPAWFATAERCGANLLGVANYEMAKNGKYYTTVDQYMAEKAIPCIHMMWPPGMLRKTVETLQLDFPANALIVVDEAHRGKNARTQTSALLKRIRMHIGTHATMRMAVLSATITDCVEDFRMTAFVLGVAQYETHPYKAWIRRITAAYPGETISACIHHVIFPAYGARMRKAVVRATEGIIMNNANDTNDLKTSAYEVHFHMWKWMMSLSVGQCVHVDIYISVIEIYNSLRMFRDSIVRAVVYDVSPEVEAEIASAHEDINAAIEALKLQQIGAVHPLTLILRARQRLEMLKSQTMVEQAMEFLFHGFAVVLFVNFTPTIKRMIKQLEEFMASDEMLLEDADGNAYHRPFVSVIRGGQTTAEREHSIAQFQCGQSHVCIVNVFSGGACINLHHIRSAARPRKTLFSPPWSAIVLAQGLGRVDRVGALSDSEQIIVYCRGAVSAAIPGGADTDGTIVEGAGRINIEERMAANINRKLQTIGWLNDGDLVGTAQL